MSVLGKGWAADLAVLVSEFSDCLFFQAPGFFGVCALRVKISAWFFFEVPAGCLFVAPGCWLRVPYGFKVLGKGWGSCMDELGSFPGTRGNRFGCSYL